MPSRFLAACAAAVLVVAAGSCSPGERHKALTLFFDGVPPLEEPPAPGEAVAVAAAPAERFFREHGPYGAKLCHTCHESTASNTYVVPRDELCAQCHTFEPKRFQHDPLDDCLGCHDPHSSAYRYLLVAAPNQVCTDCHDPATLPEDSSHTDASKLCTDCHDPHQSDREDLLR